LSPSSASSVHSRWRSAAVCVEDRSERRTVASRALRSWRRAAAADASARARTYLETAAAPGGADDGGPPDEEFGAFFGGQGGRERPEGGGVGVVPHEEEAGGAVGGAAPAFHAAGDERRLDAVGAHRLQQGRGGGVVRQVLPAVVVVVAAVRGRPALRIFDVGGLDRPAVGPGRIEVVRVGPVVGQLCQHGGRHLSLHVDRGHGPLQKAREVGKVVRYLRYCLLCCSFCCILLLPNDNPASNSICVLRGSAVASNSPCR